MNDRRLWEPALEPDLAWSLKSPEERTGHDEKPPAAKATPRSVRK